MRNIIASYLVQKKECSLPGIGHFKIITKSSEHDIANKELIPPADEIIFIEEEVHLRKDLVTYVSHHQQIHEDFAAENIGNWCAQTKEKIDAGERIYFQSLGSLQKDAEGKVVFDAENGMRFFDAVRAERVIHESEEHAVLVGDRETTSFVMNEFYNAVSVIEKKPRWKIWAIVLFIFSFFILILHFSRHRFTTSGVGNQMHLAVPAPADTYEKK